MKSSSAKGEESKAVSKKCKHRAARYCELSAANGGKCCECLDKRPWSAVSPQQDDETAVATSTANEPQQLVPVRKRDYCRGCYNYYEEKALAKKAARLRDFEEWRRDPLYDPERTILCTNFYLRRGLPQLPFEVVHVILSFGYDKIPIPFFRTFDRAPRERKKMSPNSCAWRLQRMLDRGLRWDSPTFEKCPHEGFCELGKRSCCACRDQRPDPTLDGDFWKYYCPACQGHWRERPKENPFEEQGK